MRCVSGPDVHKPCLNCWLPQFCFLISYSVKSTSEESLDRIEWKKRGRVIGKGEQAEAFGVAGTSAKRHWGH